MAGLRYLLDTNILSEPSRPRPDPGVQSRLHLKNLPAGPS